MADSGLSRQADARSRSVRIRNLPPASQEGLLQQVLEKHALVKRVEIFTEKNEAVVELESPAVILPLFILCSAFTNSMLQEAGKLLLRTEPIIYNGNTLKLSEDSKGSASSSLPSAPPIQTAGLFVPRAAVSRPRAGLGHARKPVVVPSGSQALSGPAGGTRSSKVNKGKGQDDFRKLLG